MLRDIYYDWYDGAGGVRSLLKDAEDNPEDLLRQAVFAFRRYEDASLRYTGIDSHEALTHIGLYDTVVARE